jgi:hypothetical protein
MSAVVMALAGVVALWLPAFRFRIDAVTCATWPSYSAGPLYALAYVAAVVLLTAAWLRAIANDWPLGRVLVLGTLVHAAALVAPPFASNDPLYYAAIGRVMTFGGDPHAPLSSVLPAGDRVLALLPDGWHAGTTPYGPAFNQLAHAIARLGGDDVTLQLRLYQALNLVLLVVTAAAAGLAFGARAAAWVLFAPLAIVDGTINPHNDVLLALGTALFALAVARRRDAAGTLALLATLMIKLSGSLLVAYDLGRHALAPFARRLAIRRVLLAGAVVAALTVAFLVVMLRLHPELGAFAALVGDPAERYPHFTRSVEGLPRALLTYILHRPFASWALGLGFRAGAALWLLYCAFRAAKSQAPLRWAATALFGYYLFLHAFLQSWYLLPLLPLATQLDERWQPSLRLFVVCLTLYYALHLPLDCDTRPVVVGAKELVEAALVILPATATLMVAWRRGTRAHASAGS